jgi:pyruvate dehydrogenase E2 component (dihydrolipoamide acetyltransferase)
MSVEVKLPELGENIEKGDVVRVLVNVGDAIKADQPIVELETDKATIEVPTSVGGVVAELKVKVGDKIKVGQVILVLRDGPPRAVETKPADVKVAEAAAPAEVAEKASATAAPAAAAPKGSPAPVVDISTGRPAAARAETAAVPPAPGAPVPASPTVRRYARELGVSIGDVPGSGPAGRISQDDVTAFVKKAMTGGGRSGGTARQAPLPDFTKYGAVDVRPMSNIRRKTAEHLTAAWQAPHVTQHDKADVTAVEDFRKAHAAQMEKTGVKLTVTAIVIKILSLGIAKYPQFASSVDMANESIVFKKYCHIGVAVDTPMGLLVPVIRDVDKKTITDIASELATLSQKARDKKLSIDDMSGGVFSVTNLGGIGGTSFTPIVNQPEVAILGLSRTAIEPVWIDGQFVPRPMLPLSLSYDHRVIDGADAARFLRFVAGALEQPMSVYL